MPKITFSSIIGTLSENLGGVLDSMWSATAAAINAAARYRGTWTTTLDVKAHDVVLYQNALWDALVDSVNVPPVAGTSWRQMARVLGTGAITSDDIADGAILTNDIATGGQISKEQLEYIAASDIANGVAIPATTNLASPQWVDVFPNQTFVIERADSRQIGVFPSGCVNITTTAASGGRFAAQLVFDSTTSTPRTLQVGGGWVGQNQFENVLQGTGTPRITGLPVGSRLVKMQVACEVAATLYCRAASVPIWENFKLRIVENKR